MVNFEQDQLSQMRLVRIMVAVACLEWLQRDAAHLVPDGFIFGLEQITALLELEVEVEVAMSHFDDGASTENRAIAFYLTMLDPSFSGELSDTWTFLFEDYLDTSTILNKH